MKRSLSLFLLSVLILLGSFGNVIYATDSEPEAKVTDDNNVKIGVFYADGYFQVDSKEGYSGYVLDYIEMLEKYTSWDVEYVLTSRENCIELLSQGEIDILPLIHRTEAEINDFAVTDFNMGYDSLKLMTLSDNTELSVNAYEDFNGMRIGFGDNYAFNEMAKYAAENNFIYYPQTFENNANAISALNNGQVDAICLNNSAVPHHMRVISDFNPTPLYFAMASDDAKLIDQINTAMGRLLNDDPLFANELKLKYFPVTESDKIILSSDEKLYANTYPVIKVAIDNNLNPIEWFDIDSNQYLGYTIKVLEYITENTGIRFEYVFASSYEESLRLLENNEVDIITSGHINNRNDTDNLYSSSYLEASNVLVGKNTESPNTSKVIVAVPPKSITDEADIKLIYPDADIVYTDSIIEAFELVEDGQADYLVSNIYTAQWALTSFYPEFSIALEMTEVADFHFIYSDRVTTPFVNIMEKSIDSLTQSQISEMIVDTTISSTTETSTIVSALMMGIFAIIVVILAIHLLLTLLRTKKRLYHLAYYDDVTKLMNLKKFYEDAHQVTKSNPNLRFAVVILDMRNFQIFNESHGFDKGNQLLQLIADTAKSRLNHDVELAARVASDEFIVLLEAENTDALLLRTQNSALYVHNTMREQGFGKIKFAYGCYLMDRGSYDIHDAYEKATLAHKTAKKSETLDFCIFDDQMKKKAQREQEIENSVEAALLNDEFKIYLQPQYNSKTKTIFGAEALVRWIKPSGEMIPPGEFIYICERNGFVKRIDYYIFEQACKLIRSWIDMGIKPVHISVNFSRHHLNSEDFVNKLAMIADKYLVPHDLLTIEITETTILNNEEALLNHSKLIKQYGFKLSMDDFGSGYSSLGLLKSVPVDELKLDRSFFVGGTDDEKQATIISSIISMSNQLGLITVAEGIESMEQVEHLVKMDCDVIQGYVFAKPAPGEILTRLLKEEQGFVES